jgi:protein SFI1
MGIEIEFDHDNGEEQHSRFEDSQYSLETSAADDPPPQDENEDPRRCRRRNSESSAWDPGNDLPSRSSKRRNSVSSVTKVSHQTGTRPNILREAPPHQQQIPLRADNLQNQKEDGPEHNVGTWLKARPERPRRGRTRSISTHGSMRIRRRSPSVARRVYQQAINHSIPASDEFQAPSEITAVTSGFGDDATSDLAIPTQIYLSNEDANALLQIKASLILQRHFSFLAKSYLRHWRDKALQLREDNIGLEAIAKNHDKKALLQSALDSWRLFALRRRQAAETERFFAHIERRAARARDLYLMHVAFTHWSVYANEQVQRTALARRHIVRTRIFNAWRDITAVNELKVRRQVLKKFLLLWKRQLSVALEDVNFALQKYEGNLVEKVYKQWVQKLWTFKATVWWAEGVKRRTLFRWIVVSHQNWEAHRTAEEKGRLRLTWHAWQIWRTKTETQLLQNQEAEQYHQDHTRLIPLRKWRHETRMVPAKNTVQIEVSVRLMRETFEAWLHRTRQERKSGAVDRMKILQEALTNWRHKSRFQLVRNYVEKNSKSATIYKWIVARRCVDRRKELNWDLLHGCYKVWVQKMRLLQERRWHEKALAQSFTLQRTRGIVFRHWYSRMDSRQQLETTALNFRPPRVLHNVVSKWLEQSQRLQQLQYWSRDAEFYFLATKAMKRWRASTEAAKREKRKAAYIQVRRTAKINLARGAFRTWLHKAQHALDLDGRARKMSQNRNIIIGMDIFDRWRARTDEIAELESLWRDKVLKKKLIIWRDRSNALRAFHTEAILTYQERRQSRTLKKWGLLSLQLRAQTNYAADICEKNAKRTFRKMFTYWHQKAAQRRPRKEVEIPPTGIASGPLGSTARAEEWSDFGEDPEIDEWAKGVVEATISTPIPGYLSTPSKRTERVMAVAAKFSTTPKAPLSTPFERHLRAQWSGGLLPPLRKGRGKSSLSMGGEFEDIVESNANNDLEQRGQ